MLCKTTDLAHDLEEAKLTACNATRWKMIFVMSNRNVDAWNYENKCTNVKFQLDINTGIRMEGSHQILSLISAIPSHLFV